MSSEETLILSAEGKTRPVKLTVRCFDKDGKPDDPSTMVLDLEIVEMAFGDHEKFMDQHRRRLAKDETGDITVKNWDGLRMELLSKSLRLVDGPFVTAKLFEKHKVPGTTLQTLYLECQKMNAANQSVDDLVKLYAEALKDLAKEGKLTAELIAKVTEALETPSEAGE